MNRTLLIALLLGSAAADAATPEELVQKLSDREAAAAVLEEIVALKEAAIPAVIAEASTGKDTQSRGWAIVALTRIGGADASKALRKIEEDRRSSMLIRTWAAAGRIELATSFAELGDLAVLVQYYPATQRPLAMKAVELANAKGASLDGLLRMTVYDESGMLAPVLAEPILSFGAGPLARSMVKAKDMDVRMQAAGFLGTLAERQGAAGNEIVGTAVARAYAFDPAAKKVPWAGGPLYIPGIAWEEAYSKKLIGNLVKWGVYCDRKQDQECISQIANNLMSIGLPGAQSFQGYDGPSLLRGWGQVAGKDAVKKILQEQGIEKDERWAAILAEIP